MIYEKMPEQLRHLKIRVLVHKGEFVFFHPLPPMAFSNGGSIASVRSSTLARAMNAAIGYIESTEEMQHWRRYQKHVRDSTERASA